MEHNLEISILTIYVIPIFLSIGIFKRKDLARRVCLWYFWIMGIMTIFSSLILDHEANMLRNNILSVMAYLILITIFLELPGLKKCFVHNSVNSGPGTLRDNGEIMGTVLF
jgi:hypothetical protein